MSSFSRLTLSALLLAATAVPALAQGGAPVDQKTTPAVSRHHAAKPTGAIRPVAATTETTSTPVKPAGTVAGTTSPIGTAAGATDKSQAKPGMGLSSPAKPDAGVAKPGSTAVAPAAPVSPAVKTN